MSDFKIESVVWYTDAGQVRPGVLLNIIEPSEERAKEGAKVLYELCHGFAAETIYATKEQARGALQNDEVSSGSDSAAVESQVSADGGGGFDPSSKPTVG